MSDLKHIYQPKVTDIKLSFVAFSNEIYQIKVHLYHITSQSPTSHQYYKLSPQPCFYFNIFKCQIYQIIIVILYYHIFCATLHDLCFQHFNLNWVQNRGQCSTNPKTITVSQQESIIKMKYCQIPFDYVVLCFPSGSSTCQQRERRCLSELRSREYQNYLNKSLPDLRSSSSVVNSTVHSIIYYTLFVLFLNKGLQFRH